MKMFIAAMLSAANLDSVLRLPFVKYFKLNKALQI